MPALITIEEAQEAIFGGPSESPGEELSNEDLAKVLYYIALVSQYIASYTGVAFSSVEHTSRLKADYYGRISLPHKPVAEIESVKNWRSSAEHPRWQWDGLDEIYGLHPTEVVEVTFTSGYSVVPEDIKFVAREAVKRLYLAPDGEGQDLPGRLTKFRVGDVDEGYPKSNRDDELGNGLFNDLDVMILNQYRDTMMTYAIGFSQADNLTAIPSSESALYE
jgi:hypothetical protein